MVFDGIFPKAVVFLAKRLVRLDGDFPSHDFDGGTGLGKQIEIPGSVIFLAPVGANQEIIILRMEISDRGDVMATRLAPNGKQQQDILRAEPAADTPPAGPDGEGVQRHE